MTITYINNFKVITDAVQGLLRAEYQIPIIISDYLELEYLTEGEYLQLWFDESEHESGLCKIETRTYPVLINYFFNVSMQPTELNWDDVFSEKIEHLLRLFHNNRYYSPSSVYKWTNLTISHQPPIPVSEMEELTEEFEGMENIKVIQFRVDITRSNEN
jgi:hypothetical protein